MTVLLLMLAIVQPQDPDAEKLKKFEQSYVRKDPRKKQEEPKKYDDPLHKRDDDEDDYNLVDAIAESFFAVVFEVIAYPFQYALSDRGLRFDDYPYAHGRKYFLGSNDAEKDVAFEADLTTGRVEHDLWSVGLGGIMRWPSGCDFRFDITQYWENVDTGTDRLTLQQYGLDFGILGRRRSSQMTLGIGMGILQGEDVADVAPLVEAEFMHFPKGPLSLRCRAAIMGFNEGTLTDLRLELGVHLGRFALTAGVRSLINSDGDELTGPTLGCAVFF
jgi:hypothetical protein